MGIEELLRELREDRVHGASWYFMRGLEVIKLAVDSGLGGDDIRALLSELRRVRPGMASLINLADIINDAVERGMDLNTVIARLRDWYEGASARLISQLDKYPVMCGSSAMTISYSSAVKTALSRWGRCFDTLYVMESRPGNEVSQAIRDYSSHVGRVVPIPDSAIAHFMRSVDYVISGADGLYSDGYFLNKVGTEALFIVAHRFDVDAIVIAESYKAAVGGVDEVYTVDFSVDEQGVKVPLFDKVPLDLIDYLITDVDIIRKPKPENIGELRQLLINNVLSQGGQE